MRKLKLAASAAMGMAALSLAMPAQAQERTMGDIFMSGYGFCPRGTAETNGQLLAISSHDALFSLYGTTYGGDGRTTFALPDLRGRSPIHLGTGPGLPTYRWGQRGGAPTTTLSVLNLPSHSHNPQIHITRIDANTRNPISNTFARAEDNTFVEDTDPGTDQMHSGTITSSNVGGGQSFNNMQPFLTIRFCAVMLGIYPSRN